MKNRNRRIRLKAVSLLLSGLVALSPASSVFAEEYYDDYSYEDDSYEDYTYEDDSYEDDSYDEYDDGSSDEEETEYIPDAYYAPIQTNDLTGWPLGPAVQAAGVIVMDMQTQAVLYGKSIYEKHYPASITKIMTLLVAVENSSPDDKFACSAEVFNIEADSSNAGIAPGEELTMHQALDGLMLESANDLGMAIAVQIAGSVSAFADMMNEKARELGCVNTHFANPHGLHNEDHYTCAYDMALIGRAAYANESARAYMATVEANIPPTNMTDETRYFINHHRMLRDDSEYYQSWCTGGKTGYTDAAWNTLVTFGEKNGLSLVCVVLQENGAGRSYLETTELMNYGFDNFKHRTIGIEVNSPTYAQILGLDYPGEYGKLFKSDKLDKKVLKIGQPGTVTLPPGVSSSAVVGRGNENEAGVINYYYEDSLIGSGSIALNPLPENVHFPFEEKRDAVVIQEEARERQKYSEIEETAFRAINNVRSFFGTAHDTVTNYVENNQMTVALIGALILFVLLILIAILILRVSSDYRIRRRRKIAERQRRRREEEIERKSALEIEEELREVMEQEKLIREVEEKKLREQEERKAKEHEKEDILREVEKIERGE